MDNITLNLPLIGSPSRTELLARCFRRGLLSDIACVQPSEGRASREANLDFGSAIHAGAAEWWRSGDPGKMQQSLQNAWAAKPVISNDLTVDLAESMLRYYASEAKLGAGHWAAKLPGWELVACEDRQVVEIDGRALAFQLDRLAHHAESDAWVQADLKTAKRFGAWWERGWRLSLQQQLYCRATQLTRGVTPDVWIEGLKKSMPTELQYVECPAWTESELDEAVGLFLRLMDEAEALTSLAKTADGAVDVEEFLTLALTQARFNRGDCFSYGRECEFYDLCKAEPEHRLGMLLAKYEYVEPDWIG